MQGCRLAVTSRAWPSQLWLRNKFSQNTEPRNDRFIVFCGSGPGAGLDQVWHGLWSLDGGSSGSSWRSSWGTGPWPPERSSHFVKM